MIFSKKKAINNGKFCIFHAQTETSSFMSMDTILLLSVIFITTALLAHVDFKAATGIVHTHSNTGKYAFDQLNANTQTVLLNQLTKQN